MVKTGWLGDQKPLETTFKLFLGLSLSSIFMLISPFFPVMMSYPFVSGTLKYRSGFIKAIITLIVQIVCGGSGSG